MKKRKLVFLFAAITLLLSACGSKNTGMETDITDSTETIGAETIEETTTPAEPAETDKLPLYVEDGACERGNICVFGKYQLDDVPGNEDMEWIILEKSDDKILVISRYILPEGRPFNDVVDLKTGSTWERCTLRTWLNKDFYDAAFSEEEKAAIITTQVDNYRFTSGDDDPHNYTYDNVFCLSNEEYKNYMSDLPTEAKDGRFYAVNSSYAWWLRTHAEGDDGLLYTMYYHNGVKKEGKHNYEMIGIRPALSIDLNAVEVKELSEETDVETPSCNTTESTASQPESEVLEAGDVGSIVSPGTYEQDNNKGNGKETIEWIVLDKQDGKALLLSKYILYYAKYNDTESAITWEKSSLRDWLNNTFAENAFSATEKTALIQTTLKNADNPKKGIDGGNDTEDLVFCLSYDEVTSYIGDNKDYLVSTFTQSCEAQKEAEKVEADPPVTWWLRTPGGFETSALTVGQDGGIGSYGSAAVLPAGVRPAIWVSIKSDGKTASVQTTDAAAGEQYAFSNKLTVGTEADVKARYLEKLVIQEAVRTLVAERMNATSFVKVDALEKFDIKEVLIDEVTGNPILSGGTKALLNAVSDQKGVAEILDETLVGAAGGVEDYLTGEIQGAITDVIGVDVFSAADFINAWNNADSTPRVLLQNIVDDQQEDVARLVTFLQQDQMNAADILKVAQLVYCMHVREDEIGAIQGKTAEDSDDDYAQLRELAARYADVEAQIEIYDACQTEAVAAGLSSDELKTVQGLQQEIGAVISGDSALAELEVGDIAVNYDVRSFVEAQKSTSQSGVIADQVLGSLFGSMASEDMQTVENWVQEKRSELYNKLTDYMEESFAKVASAKALYDLNTETLKLLSTADETAAYLVRAYTQDGSYTLEYEAAKQAYIAALERYYVDLSYAYQFYACVLTQEQRMFLDNLKAEKEAIKACIDSYDVNMLAGYTKEERDERYNELMKLYIDAVDYIQVRGAALGQTPGFQYGADVNTYNGLGECHSYRNGDQITVIIRLRTGESIYGEGAGVRCYYDMEGNPIYIHAGSDWVSFFENEIMAYNLMNDAFLMDYKESAEQTMAVFTNAN